MTAIVKQGSLVVLIYITDGENLEHLAMVILKVEKNYRWMIPTPITATILKTNGDAFSKRKNIEMGWWREFHILPQGWRKMRASSFPPSSSPSSNLFQKERVQSVELSNVKLLKLLYAIVLCIAHARGAMCDQACATVKCHDAQPASWLELWCTRTLRVMTHFLCHGCALGHTVVTHLLQVLGVFGF